MNVQRGWEVFSPFSLNVTAPRLFLCLFIKSVLMVRCMLTGAQASRQHVVLVILPKLVGSLLDFFIYKLNHFVRSLLPSES